MEYGANSIGNTGIRDAKDYLNDISRTYMQENEVALLCCVVYQCIIRPTYVYRIERGFQIKHTSSILVQYRSKKIKAVVLLSITDCSCSIYYRHSDCIHSIKNISRPIKNL